MKLFDKAFAIILLNCLFSLPVFSQSADVFSDLNKALQSPLLVKTLDLSDQKLSTLPDNISVFQNLETLNLSGNPGLDLKSAFRNLAFCGKLKSLYLDNNNLQTLPAETANLRSLEMISLVNNEISYMPGAMSRLMLKTLDLRDNAISDENKLKIYRIIPNTTAILEGKFITAKENLSIKYYDDANKATAAGQFVLADSLYTLSLGMELSRDTYFNRAVVRKKMSNVTGYCLDLGSASAMNDKEATRLYWKDCGTIDSIFYDQKGNAVKRGAHSYCEVTSKSKYTGYVRFKRVDLQKTILVHYEVINNDTVFYAVPSQSPYSVKGKDLPYILVHNVVPTEKENKKVGNPLIVISFVVLKNGGIEHVTVSSAFGDDYNRRLVEALKKYSNKWEPAKYENRPVNYRKTISYRLNNR